MQPLTRGCPMPDAAIVRPRPDSLQSAVQSYWRVVLGRSIRPLLVKASLAYICLLLFLAVFVPFIANAHPYTILLKNSTGGYSRAYPLFADLTTTDINMLLAAAGLAACVLIHRIVPPPAAASLHNRRRACILLAICITIAGGAAVACVHHNFLDSRNYRQLLASGEAKAAVMAPIPWGYATMEPLEKDLVNKGPMAGHLLGTDGLGRDELARLLWSARVAMGIGFISQFIALALGILVGALMGYFSGVADILGMRLVEIVESVPTFFLILTFVATFGRSISMIMIILGVTGWTGYARLLRGEFFRIRSLDYVTAAHASGSPLWRVLFRHMLPNGLTPVLVSASFGLAGAVTIESSLSYLGVGVRPPTPSWGQMLNAAGNPATVFRWWQALGPGLALFLAVLAFNLVGESFRDAIDPRNLAKEP